MITANRDPLLTQTLEQPGFLFTDIARLYRIALDRRLRRVRLTRSQSWLISFLCYFEGSSQQQLANLMGTGKGGIGKLIERLEQKGLVRRESDPQDSRSKRVYLGEKIKPLTLEMGREIDNLVTRSLRELEDSEVWCSSAGLARSAPACWRKMTARRKWQHRLESVAASSPFASDEGWHR